jgi:hypothetical protein
MENVASFEDEVYPDNVVPGDQSVARDNTSEKEDEDQMGPEQKEEPA